MTEAKRKQVRELLELARLTGNTEPMGGDVLKQKVWELLSYQTRFEFNWENTDVPLQHKSEKLPLRPEIYDYNTTNTQPPARLPRS